MRSAIEYIDLLGNRGAETGDQPQKYIPRASIIVPPEHRKLDEDRAQSLISMLSEIPNIELLAAEQKAALIESATLAVSKLSKDAARAELAPNENIALEAIVIAEGIRPVIDFKDGRLDYTTAALGPWQGETVADASQIETTARSVGRINFQGQQIGTGFVVTGDQIMTNRHVLTVIGQETNDVWTIRDGATISFADAGEGGREIKLKPNGTSTSNAKSETGTSFDHFDYAIIPLKIGWFRRKLPAALSLEETRSNVIFDRTVYVLGYPGRPQAGTERFTLLKDLFQSEYGIKRYCPGTISASFADIEADHKDTVFGHDCTTLGGNSGSPVIDLGSGSTNVIGIHFAGAKRISNYAHSMAALQNEFDNDRLTYI